MQSDETGNLSDSKNQHQSKLVNRYVYTPFLAFHWALCTLVTIIIRTRNVNWTINIYLRLCALLRRSVIDHLHPPIYQFHPKQWLNCVNLRRWMQCTPVGQFFPLTSQIAGQVLRWHRHKSPVPTCWHTYPHPWGIWRTSNLKNEATALKRIMSHQGHQNSHSDVVGVCLFRYDSDRVPSWSTGIQDVSVIRAKNEAIIAGIGEVESLRRIFVYVVAVKKEWCEFVKQWHQQATHTRPCVGSDIASQLKKL